LRNAKPISGKPEIGRTANFKFTPDEQEMKCLIAPEAFEKIPNAWGAQGWTTATLSKLKAAELRHALETAWRHALPKTKAKSKAVEQKPEASARKSRTAARKSRSASRKR
jgi:hypothetical protein